MVSARVPGSSTTVMAAPYTGGVCVLWSLSMETALPTMGYFSHPKIVFTWKQSVLSPCLNKEGCSLNLFLFLRPTV